MLLTIAAVLFLLWIVGFSIHFLGALIHVLLVVALVVFILDRVRSSRRL